MQMDDKGASEFFVNDWYVQKQTETPYLKKDYNNCVRATYKQKPPSFFGYTVDVHNFAKGDSGKWKNSGVGFLAGQRNPASDGEAKFLVAPQFLPKWFAGDYWVLAHENKGATDEFAIVAGGQPKIPLADGCTFDTGVTNGSGLWIFTRKQARDDAVVEKAKQIIVDKGISLQGLNDVKQDDCDFIF